MDSAAWGALGAIGAASITAIATVLVGRGQRKKILEQVETGNGKPLAGYVMDTQHAVVETLGRVHDLSERMDAHERRDNERFEDLGRRIDRKDADGTC